MKNDSHRTHHKKGMKKSENIRSEILKGALWGIIPLLIFALGMVCLPVHIRQEAGKYVIAIVVIGSVVTYIVPAAAKVKKIAILPLAMFLIGTTIPSIIAIANPQFYNVGFLNKNVDINVIEEKYDDDLVDEVEESVAIETAAIDMDEDVFRQFYEISYVRNGKVTTKTDATESEKIQLIMDAIINDIEKRSANDGSEYNDAELNSGQYGALTADANREEQDYRDKEALLNKQQRRECIYSYLQKRLDAYKLFRTSDLARLIGHTYAELSQHQTVNDNIYSNCSAVSYYFQYCCLSRPEEKSKMYYEMGVRFNRIAEIAQGIYQQEGSEEYKEVYIDSLYMSAAYYKLYRHSFIEDYKSNFYLARIYKLLSDSMESDYSKSDYMEEALSILFALMNKADYVKEDSKKSLYRTLYNALAGYEAVPRKYWNKYTESYILEQKELVGRLMN